MDTATLLSDRARAIDASGIRRVFELASTLLDPINLSIGQPDFPVPTALKKAAVDAINNDQNGYTLTQGSPALRERIAAHLKKDVGWGCALKPGGDGPGVTVTSGTSGALHLAFLSLLSPGDEIVIQDPYFVSYPELATMCGAKAVLCDTYPDFRLTAERVEGMITERTKAVLYCSPSNPSGVALSESECRDLLDLCRSKGVLLIADEIYDEFAFSNARTQPAVGDPKKLRCPSPARFAGSEEDVLLIRGFGKTYGCTGWRLGYAAGPAPVIGAMAKLQQYTFVCAPSPLQASA
ncbi:MAG: pyridoxal phosphate-dependent aminotransferase, partial [Phycisphaerales bacterium]|nr:pyridoxal phosphate-dependent aminotransferase [Phycisphaerales bacterium]